VTGPRPAPELWLRRFAEAAGATWRLICLPHAGGNAAFFRGWPSALPPCAEVLAVQYPGRLDRTGDPCPGSLTALASEIAAAVEATNGLPTVLFGHSLGAAVAYEVVRLLSGPAAPVGLVVSGREAPSRRRPVALALDDDQAMLGELRRLCGTDELVFEWPELLSRVLTTLRSDYRLDQAYSPVSCPPVGCPILAAVGHDDPDVSPRDAAAWAAFTASRFELITLPGDHFYLVAQRDAVAAAIVRSASAWLTSR
jgi:pyochelin biosynthesis protein PchC